jgi:hypothetical protein
MAIFTLMRRLGYRHRQVVVFTVKQQFPTRRLLGYCRCKCAHQSFLLFITHSTRLWIHTCLRRIASTLATMSRWFITTYSILGCNYRMSQPKPEQVAFPSGGDPDESDFEEWNQSFMADADAKVTEDTQWATEEEPANQEQAVIWLLQHGVGPEEHSPSPWGDQHGHPRACRRDLPRVGADGGGWSPPHGNWAAEALRALVRSMLLVTSSQIRSIKTLACLLGHKHRACALTLILCRNFQPRSTYFSPYVIHNKILKASYNS